MQQTPTPDPNTPRPGAWLRRHWRISLGFAAVVAILWVGAPAWAAPVARPLNQTVPRPTPTTPGDPIATATPRPGDDAEGGDGGVNGDTGDGDGGVILDSGPNIVFPTAPADGEGAAETGDSGLTATVSVDNLNLREGPSTDYNTLGALPANAQVTVRARNDDGSWWYICCLPNTTTAGWVSAQLLAPSFDRAQANSLIAVFGSTATRPAAPASTPVPANRAVQEAAAPLGVDFRIDPPFVWQGITATLTITVNNPNPVDVVNVVLSDELPPHLVLISATADADGTVEQVSTADERTLLLFRWATLPAETAVTATIAVQVAADLADGAIVDNLIAVRARNAGYTTAAITVGMPPVVPPSFD
jgi:uncharacterized repeat protein (TIGR01451 family)